VRLKTDQHDWLKEFADARHVTMNSIFRNFVEQLTDGKIVCLVNEPKISFIAQPSNYQIVKEAKHDGERKPSQ